MELIEQTYIWKYNTGKNIKIDIDKMCSTKRKHHPTMSKLLTKHRLE